MCETQIEQWVTLSSGEWGPLASEEILFYTGVNKKHGRLTCCSGGGGFPVASRAVEAQTSNLRLSVPAPLTSHTAN